jgi:hypothetical protein
MLQRHATRHRVAFCLFMRLAVDRWCWCATVRGEQSPRHLELLVGIAALCPPDMREDRQSEGNTISPASKVARECHAPQPSSEPRRIGGASAANLQSLALCSIRSPSIKGTHANCGRVPVMAGELGRKKGMGSRYPAKNG